MHIEILHIFVEHFDAFWRIISGVYDFLPSFKDIDSKKGSQIRDSKNTSTKQNDDCLHLE